MPNWLHLVTDLIYHLGLALWIGGTVALGALTAPALFRALPRPEAGAIFGPILRRFARVRVAAILPTIVAAAVRLFVWERQVNVWITIRWAALAFLAFTVVYEIVVLEKALEARRVHLTPEMAPDDPRRAEFQRLHKRAERLLSASLAAAVVAVFLS